MDSVALSDDYWKDLVQYIQDDRPEPTLGEFKGLQIMNIAHLMNEVVRIKANIRHNKTTSAEEAILLRDTLHHYSMSIFRASTRV